MASHFLEEPDVDTLFSIGKIILKFDNVIETPKNKMKYRDKLGELIGCSGETLYNQIILPDKPWISRRSLVAFKKNYTRFFDSLKGPDLLKLEGLTKKKCVDLYNKISNQKLSTPPKKARSSKNKPLSSSAKLKAFENTNWHIFFFEEVIKTEKGKPIVYEGVSWAILNCQPLGRAELIKQKSPNDNKATSIYTGRYSLARDNKDLQLELKLGTVRDLRITCYTGDTDYFDVCVGMATNVTETFEAWTVLMVSASQIENKELKPGFQSQELNTVGNIEIPDYIWSFFKEKSNVYLAAPKTGTGIKEIYTIINGRKS
jgi:hypothetical protein